LAVTLPPETATMAVTPPPETTTISKTEDATTTTAIESLIEEEEDREDMKRPYMEATSNSILNSILDIERTYSPGTPECNAFGGSKFLSTLIASSKSLYSGGNSSITSYQNGKMDIFYGENVSLLVQNPPPNEKHYKPTIYLQVEKDEKISIFNRGFAPRKENDDSTTLKQMTKMFLNSTTIPQFQPSQCTHYFEYPVMLVDHDVDSNNWWFLLLSLLKHYITFAVIQSKVDGDYNHDLRVLHTLPDKTYFRSFVDGFEFMFSDRRGRDSRQIWHVPPMGTTTATTKSSLKRYCFRKLVWSPGAMDGGSSILINHQHKNDTCFSSIVYSYAAYLKASMHIPTLPRPTEPRIVWVGRNTIDNPSLSSWQRRRLISNQDEIITYLKQKCQSLKLEFLVADFYGNKGMEVAYEEQAQFVSRSDIMIGVHGAGLNMFHFMPFHSIVIEIHLGSNIQRNSANFVAHTLEGKYIPTNGRKVKRSGRDLAVEPIWDTLEGGIRDWKTLPQDIRKENQNKKIKI